MMVHHFDVVPVRIKHVRGAVARLVAGSFTRLGVAAVSGADRDGVRGGGLPIDELGQVAVERLRELKVRSVVGVREQDQFGVWQVLLQDV